MARDPLRDAIRRLALARRVTQAMAPVSPSNTTASVSGDQEGLLRRLDDKGCTFGRLTGVRVEELARNYERLEAKVNAMLLSLTGTFVVTILGLVIYYLRGRP